MIGACAERSEEVTTKESAVVGDPIESVQQTQGVAPSTMVIDLGPNASIKNVSFTLGLSTDDQTMCKARHPPPPACDWDLHPEGQNYDNQCFVLNVCGIMSDLALAPINIPYPAFEDVSVISVVANVASSTTLHWRWKYEAWQRELVSAFTLDLVTQDGTTTHIIKPIAAPPGWGSPGQQAYGPYSVGESKNDLELSRFWPNQKVTLRFILRNTYEPGYINWVFPANPNANGLSDIGAAKIIVNDLHVTTDNCPLGPIPPIEPDAQRFEDAAQAARNCTGLADVDSLVPEMQAALTCLEQAVNNAGGTLIVDSAYRPASYQWHLYYLYQQYRQLLNNTDPACAERKAQVIDEVTHVHCIQRSGAAKGDQGQHPRGRALDLTAQGVNLIQLACGCGLYRPYPEDGSSPRGVIDRPHYQMKPPGAVCK